MTQLLIAAHAAPRAITARLIMPAALLLLAAGAAAAQTAAATDGKTPPGIAPGAPAGSYALSGFDNVNLYSGNLNFNLPLVKVGGRGEAQTSVRLSIDSVRWTVQKADGGDGTPETPPCGSELVQCTHPPITGSANTWWSSAVPDPNWWHGLKVGYGPGVMHGRRQSDKGLAPRSLAAANVLTRLTFTAADGTEYELRDVAQSGNPVRLESNAQVSRGTVFVSADGAAATFVSDTEIIDSNSWSLSLSRALSYPTGYLLLADGTRYRIEQGLVRWLRDRHGNRITFEYDASKRVSVITDPLGRRVTFTYADASTPYDQINYDGVGGAPRTIRVWRTTLALALRDDYPSLKTYTALFPELDPWDETFNPNVASAVELPDGRKYLLRYNPYGELARVVLPTGGSIEYDYTPGSSVTPQQEIHRRVVARRVFSAPGELDSLETFAVSYPSEAETAVVAEQFDGGGARLSRTRHSFYGSAIGFQPPGAFYPPWDSGKERETLTLDPSAADAATAAVLRRVAHVWQPGTPLSQWATTPDAVGAPYIASTATTLSDVDLVSRQDFKYDLFNNRTDLWEYDYAAPSATSYARRHTRTEYLRTNNGTDYTSAAGPHLRRLPRAVRVFAVDPTTGAETPAAQSETRYDEAAYTLMACPEATGWVDPNTAARGNATTVARWLDPGNTWPETHTQFDQLGNARRSWDANGGLTQVTYADADGGNTRHTYAFATAALSPDPDDGGPLTPLTSSTLYDHWSGGVLSQTDPNGLTTSYSYADDSGAADPLDRLRRVTRPGGARTRYEYGDEVGDLHLRVLSDLDASRATETIRYFDGLGRGVRSFWWENQDPAAAWLTTDTEYDGLGRVRRASSRYRSAGPGSPVNPSGRWTVSTYDALGRITAVTTPDDPARDALPPGDPARQAPFPLDAKVVTTYSGPYATVTDQAGKVRRSKTDALGRLVRVDEPNAAGQLGPPDAPLQPTFYTYDALDNLRRVEQGAQLRFFMFDSLSRLIRSKQPEQDNYTPSAEFPAPPDPLTGNSNWSLAYQYDANHNLLRRKDARNVTTTFNYDRLNRSTGIDYSDSTPDVTRVYDNAAAGAHGKGRLWKSEAAATARTVVERYDVSGKPARQSTQFWVAGAWGPAYTVARGFDLAGNVTSQTYPSGRAVSYSYDEAGRLSAFAGNLGDSVTRAYASGISYDSLGGLAEERFGTYTPLFNKRSHNVRGQLSAIRLSTYSAADPDPARRADSNRGAIINHYSEQSSAKSGSDNNSNLRRQEVYVPQDEAASSSWTVASLYEYDSLNRVDRVREVQGNQDQWVQDYDYDRWGNRTVNQTNTQVYGQNPAYSIPEPQFDKRSLDSSNRLYAPGDLDAGKTEPQRKMRYDAAGQLTQDVCAANVLCARGYDAEGRMTQAQFVSGQLQTARYSYDADGRRIKRASGGGEVWQVYGIDGELLAEYAPGAAPASPRKEYGYRGSELLVTLETPEARGRANYALASNGATAAASSTLDANRSPSGAINGDRSGSNWGAGGGWHDATNNAFPDWLEVSFAAPQTIDEVSLFSVQDTYWSPQEPSDASAFTQYGLVDFDVQRWDGAQWVTVPGGEVRGNNKVWRRVTFPAVTTQKVRVLVRAGQAGYSRVAELEAWGPSGPPPPRTNVAVDVGGATAVASSTLDAGRSAAGAINGDRAGRNWGAGGGWHDATNNSYPDWLEVRFAGSRTVDEVDLFSVQDNFLSPSEPTEQMTFTKYGVTAFDVEYWDGSAWQTAAAVANNNLVWRRVSFAPVTTTKLRVLVRGGVAGYSRIAEVEAYGGGARADVRWLVSDQLGTPRMVVDETGRLAGVTRHDYLPFGEDLVGVGGRSAALGYGGGDGVRHKFAGAERDDETGLNYLVARYYSPGAGRFTSPDSVQLSAEHIADPQRWNPYSYVGNNPLALVDPDGRDGQGQDGKRIITVFLNYAKEELNAGHYDSEGRFVTEQILDKPDWNSLKQEAASRGFELVIKDSYTGVSPDAASDFEKAASISELVVVAGHAGWDSSANVAAISLGPDRGITTPGNDLFLLSKNTSEVNFGGKALVNFGCDTDALPVDKMINASGTDAQYIGVKDGDGRRGSSVPTNNRAAYNFVRTYIKSGGNISSARVAAQNTYARSTLLAPGRNGEKPINHDVKDKVTTRPMR